MTISRVDLGGLDVSAQGLGCMGMSQSYGHGDWDESVATIHRAFDLGVTFLDTANVSSPSDLGIFFAFLPAVAASGSSNATTMNRKACGDSSFQTCTPEERARGGKQFVRPQFVQLWLS